MKGHSKKWHYLKGILGKDMTRNTVK
jgi:hypothetical protein